MTSDPDALHQHVMNDVRRVYTDTVVDHAMNPRNVGEIPDADGHAMVFGSCGDSFETWLRIRDEKVDRAQFWTDGCAAQIAAGSITTELVAGKPVAEAQRINAGQILNALGGLPEENEHCAERAARAIKDAIKEYRAFEREPWKRAYKRL